MNCTNCNTPLTPGSGFCGACGQPVAPPPQAHAGYPQQPGYPAQPQYAQQPAQAAYPPQPGYPQQPPPQQAGYPQQPGYPPQQDYPQGSAPGMYPPQGYPPQQAMQPSPPPSHGLRPYPIVMQQRLTRLTGQLFLAPTRLFFLCESQKGGMAIALGRGVGGLVGGMIAGLAAPTPGQAPVVDEPTLYQAIQQMPGSMVMEPQQFKAIKVTMWTRGIFYGGKTYALPNGLDKELKHQLGLWCQANNVRQAGLIK